MPVHIEELVADIAPPAPEPEPPARAEPPPEPASAAVARALAELAWREARCRAD